MKPAWKKLASLQPFIILALALGLLYMGRDEWHLFSTHDEDEAAVAPRVALDHGSVVVTVDAAAQKAAGFVVQPVAPAMWRDAVHGYALVLNPQPMMQWRSRWQAAHQEALTAAAQRQRADAELERVRALYQDDRNASLRALQTAETDARGAHGRAEAADSAVQALREEARAQWGAVMADALAEPEGGMAAPILKGDAVLLQVAGITPSEVFGRASTRLVVVSGQDQAKPAAHFVSAAPQADALLPGSTWLWTTTAHGLRLGSRIAVEAEGEGGTHPGFAIPETAVVWNEGQAWVYRQVDETRFARQAIDPSRPLPTGGYFEAGGFKQGDRLVLTGAQLLLSEEGRLQIRNENQE
jgi:hypothetical protein